MTSKLNKANLLNKWSLEEMKQALIDCYGVVRHVAKRLQCSPNTIYDYLDTYEELKEVRDRAKCRMHDQKVETAEDVMDKLMEMTETDPSQAYKSSSFILKNSKKSHYFNEKGEESKEQNIQIICRGVEEED